MVCGHSKDPFIGSSFSHDVVFFYRTFPLIEYQGNLYKECDYKYT
ncbi:hypothetical protein BACCIP111899_02652 [Bacillus rhizoplanae]|uniref:Uncharacterized protein n=1 Tax=Bacillus rhizoplanae TaxID=2880966 RepID=A0ABN7ZXL5_9BACI|nr:hypothetical protein BACCIP111899_02652 [Bacillus rhizoplanae]